MRWTRLELAILAKFTRYPRSITPRERYTKLATIRTCLVSIVLLLLGLTLASVGHWTASTVLLVTGTVLYLLGLGLLFIIMILTLIVILVFGDGD
jgi:purine-cytosine permease-like protein